MKKFFRSCLYKTSNKIVDESKLKVRYLKMPKNDLSYFNLSSNPIISFVLDDKVHYFRECPRVLGFKEYFQNAVSNFFETIHQLNIPQEHFKQEIPIKTDFTNDVVFSFQQYLTRLLKKDDFFKKIADMDRISQRLNFSIWEQQIFTNELFNSFGLFDLPYDCRDIAVYFIWYMRNVSSTYRTIKIVRGNEYSYFSAFKSIASKIVADSLNLNSMVTSAEFCMIEKIGGESLFGIISNAAIGERMVDSNITLSGSFQRELINLNALDAICYQPDHGPNNYSVSYTSDECSVCAFDNDNPNTFFPILSASISLAGCAPLVNKNGLVNRPFFDKDLAERIFTLDIRTLQKRLKPYLNKIQIIALVFRIKNLKKAIKKTSETNPLFLLEKSQWNDQTVSLELSGKYGETYLTKAINKKGEQR
ncbi:MAG: hypothetical protein IJZ57_07490 [Clostridia bacterium]|nr:hypothetical protein [Clostridia bacterium]